MKNKLSYTRDMEAFEHDYKNSNYASCINSLNKILDDLPRATRHQDSLNVEKNILSHLISCYIALYGYGSREVAEGISRATQLSEELEDNTFIFSLLWTNWSNVIVNGNIAQAQHFASEIVDLAEKHPEDKVIFVEAFHCLGVTEFNAGHFEQSAKFLTTALQEFQEKNRRTHIQNYGNDAEVLLLSWLSWCNLISGNMRRSMVYRNILVAALHECTHDSSYAFGYIFNAMNFVFQDQPDACINALNTLDCKKIEKLPFWSSWGNIIRKWAEYHTDGKLNPIEQDIQNFIDLQGNIWEPFFLALQADMNANAHPENSAAIFDELITNIKLRRPSFHSVPVLYFYCKYYRERDPQKCKEAQILARAIIEKQGAFYWKDKFGL